MIPIMRAHWKGGEKDYPLTISDNGIPIYPSRGELYMVGGYLYLVYDVLWVPENGRIIVYSIRVRSETLDEASSRPDEFAAQAGWIPA